jgi:hypothetical protein
MSSTSLPEELVERLFSRFLAFYGAQKVGAMWNGADVAEVKAVWGEQLGRYRQATIGAALQKLIDSGNQWPPTLPEFVELCRLAAVEKHAGDRFTLAAPGSGYTDTATAREILGRIKAAIKRPA